MVEKRKAGFCRPSFLWFYIGLKRLCLLLADESDDRPAVLFVVDHFKPVVACFQHVAQVYTLCG
jgi:hypothetical protein